VDRVHCDLAGTAVEEGHEFTSIQQLVTTRVTAREHLPRGFRLYYKRPPLPNLKGQRFASSPLLKISGWRGGAHYPLAGAAERVKRKIRVGYADLSGVFRLTANESE
jgi:hypothetical protein